MQLQVTNAEAQVAEQLNNLRSIEIQLEQNRLRNARSIIDLEYQIEQLKDDLLIDKELVTEGILNRRDYLKKEEELVYQQKLLKLAIETQKTDEQMQKQQLEAQRITTDRLEQTWKLPGKTWMS